MYWPLIVLGISLSAVCVALLWFFRIRRGANDFYDMYRHDSETILKITSESMAHMRWEPSSGCILIIDDEDQVSKSLHRILTQAGHRSRVAYSGEQAFELMRLQDPAFILLDLQLPGISGWAFRRALLKTKWRHIPIAIMTGNVYADSAMNMGVVALLEKPIDPSALLALIGKYVTPIASA